MGHDGEDEEFERLLADIRSDPERIRDPSITDDQVLEIQRRLNPYAYVAGDAGNAEHKRSAAVSYTNMRADYLERYTMTSLVGFLYRVFGEWTVPEDQRRWISKAAARRVRQKAAAAESEPLTPGQLLERTEALNELARLAKEADDAAAIAVAAAQDADLEVSGLEASDAAPEAVAAAKTKAGTLLVAADGALAKSRGLQYAVMFEMRKFGLDSDKRIDRMSEIARQHREAAEVIDRDPIVRPVPGQQEVPPDVAKGIIKGFLDNWFEFNPDAHVRSAYDEFKIARDLHAVAIPGIEGEVPEDAADPLRLPLEVVRAAAPIPADPAEAEAVGVLTASPANYNAAVRVLRNSALGDALLQAMAEPERFRRFLFPIAADAPARAAVDVIPPQDTFHRWKYYSEVNMEALRTATEAIYHEKPDLDMAFIIYDVFEGSATEVAQAFEKFRDRHQDELISDIKGLDFGAWTLIGDFKENRDKINFYNRHTDVLKRILDRHKTDKELGKDLMRNRVRQAKAENIRKDGPDAPGLAEYKTQNASTSLSTVGAEAVIGREEMLRLERARGDIHAAKELEVIDQCRQTIRDLTAAAKVRELSADEERRLKDAQKDLVVAQEMIEVPEDAIQVDVWSHDTKTGSFGKQKMYTKAEAPEQFQGDMPIQQARGRPLGPAAAAARATNVATPPLAPYAQALLNLEAAERAE